MNTGYGIASCFYSIVFCCFTAIRYFGNMLNHPWRQVFIDNAGLDTPDRWIWRLADVERVPPGRASATSRRLRMASVSNQEPSDASLQKPTSWEKQSTHALNDEPTPKEFQFMFNADLALVRDFEHALDASGFVACSVLPSADGAGKPAVCPDSTTANKVTLHPCWRIELHLGWSDNTVMSNIQFVLKHICCARSHATELRGVPVTMCRFLLRGWMEDGKAGIVGGRLYVPNF